MEAKWIQKSFDYSKLIAEQEKQFAVVPEAAKIDIAAEDEKGASGVVLTASKKYQGEYCLNALVAGDKIALNATGDNKVSSAVSTKRETVTLLSLTEKLYLHRQQSMQEIR